MSTGVIEIGKHTNPNDSTIENYIALKNAILKGSRSVDLSPLYDRKAAAKRIDEINEIRKRGGKTELQVWWQKEKNVRYGSDSEYISNKRKEAIKMRYESLKKEKMAKLDKYKDLISDCSNMSSAEIRSYKTRVIDTLTGEVKDYDIRKQVVEAVGIKASNITNYIQRKNFFKERYFFTIGDKKEVL